MFGKKRKGPKIKRYRNYFRPNVGLHRVLTAVGCVAAVAVLAFLGWVVYPPVRDFLLTERETPKKTESSSSASVESGSKSTSQSSSQGTVSVPESEASSEAGEITPVTAETVKGIYLPASVAANSTKTNTLLTAAAAAGNNTVLVEAKSADGVVHFTSGNETAKDGDVISSSAYSAERIAAAVTEQGMTPAAHVYAFLDPLMSAANREMAVHYGDTEMRWLDNASDQGGKSWLNPCDEDAQEYITSLCTELAEAGFREIMLDGVQFPSGYGTDKAGYGLTSFSRSTVLADFLAKATQRVEQAGARLTLCVSAESIGEGKDEKSMASIDSKNQSLYGGDPTQLAGESGLLMLGTSSDQSAVQLFIEKNSANTDWCVCVPAYAMDGTAVSAAEALGTFWKDSDYILYNSSGTYQFG